MPPVRRVKGQTAWCRGAAGHICFCFSAPLDAKAKDMLGFFCLFFSLVARMHVEKKARLAHLLLNSASAQTALLV